MIDDSNSLDITTKGFHYPQQFDVRSAQLEINCANIAIKAADNIIGAGHMEEGPY